MAFEDKKLALQVRREIVRRQMDVSRVSVVCSHGHVELGGIIRPAMKTTTIDMERELHVVRDRVVRIPGVREVSWKYLRFAR